MEKNEDSKLNLEPEEVPIKRTRGRPRTALWRYREDGTYNRYSKIPNYQDIYEHALVQCELCGRYIAKPSRRRHTNSLICAKWSERLLKEV